MSNREDTQYERIVQALGAELRMNEKGQILQPSPESNLVWSDHLRPPSSAAGGAKYDQGKAPLDLLDAAALEGLAHVLGFGAQKYAAHNWRGGIAYSRLIAAMLRHLFAIQRGEDTDPESGLPHIDHAGCCWMFLSNMMKTRPDLDDLYPGGKA